MMCTALGVDPDALFTRGKALLEYYRNFCRYADFLPPEREGNASYGLEFCNAFEELLKASDPETVTERVSKERLSLRSLQYLMSMTLQQISIMEGDDKTYSMILENKYMLEKILTDADIMEMKGYCSSSYYIKLREAIACYSLQLLRIAIPRYRQQLRATEYEQALHPLEAI